jgi:8-oxo-dGTP pyrophosphatase MutT (NUDIX family)
MGEVLSLDEARAAKFQKAAQGRKPDVASAIVVTPDNKILVFERFCKKTGEIFYDVPGGKQEECDASFPQTLVRELDEELGINITYAVRQLGSMPSPSPKAAGTSRHYYGVFSYTGTPEDKLGRDEGHLALLFLDPAEALVKLDGRLTDEAAHFIKHLDDYRREHDFYERLLQQKEIGWDRVPG